MWLKQFKAVFGNAFKVCASDPFFLVINLALVFFMILAASMPSIGEDEHLRLVRDQTHSILFICGALAGAFGLIRVLTDDMRRGAGGILMSRPLSATTLLIGKFCGVLACVGILFLTGAFAYLWVSEITYHHEHLAMGSLSFYLIVIFMSLVAGAARQYMFNSNFSFYTSLSLCVLMGLGVAFRIMIAGKGDFDFLGLQSVVLLYLALMTYCAAVQIVAVLADSAMVLGASIMIFFFGLISSYLTLSFFSESIAPIVSSLVPNWQTYWVLEKLGQGHAVPGLYFGQCFVQAVLHAGMYLLISIILFDRIEIKGVA